MELQLLNFIKQNKENWKEILQKPPYSLIIKEDDDYILLRLDQTRVHQNQENILW